MKKVRAKFWVKDISHHHVTSPGEVCVEISMAPVYDDGNSEWSKYTPQGDLKMTITNPAAIEQFALGESYYLDITKAD